MYNVYYREYRHKYVCIVVLYAAHCAYYIGYFIRE